MSVFIDTNVVLYAALPSIADNRKRDIACDLLERSDCALSVQVLNEFVHQATHPKRDFRLDRQDALRFAHTLQALRLQPLDLSVFDAAANLALRTNYNWWDCLIVAAAIALGCDTLATEDLDHGRVIDGVRIENPFRDAA